MEQSESSHTLENAGRLKIKGPGLWSWTRIDAFGRGREIPGGLDKYAIMRRLEIDARDLRILDPQFSYPSTILAREKAILVNLE
ncbi:UNVERIFIED_CONTAM: Magnesium transporter MRS2-1, partial [Sesamum angustifolium]